MMHPGSRCCAVAMWAACLAGALPQPAEGGQDSTTTAKVKALLEKKGFDPAQLPKGAFDPKKTDPLLVVACWSPVRGDLAQLLKRELSLRHAPDLRLFLAPEGKDKKAYRFVLRGQDADVEKVLKEVLPLDADSFRKFRDLYENVVLETPTFLPAYLKDGEVNFPPVEEALRDFPRKGDLKGIRFDPKRKEKEYLWVQSAWRKAKGDQPKNGAYYVRLRQGITRHPKDDAWLLFANFDIVFLPATESDPDKYCIRIGRSDDKPDLAERLTLRIDRKPGKDLRPTGVVRSDDEGAAPELWAEYTTSPLARLAEEILTESRLKFCGKPNEK